MIFSALCHFYTQANPRSSARRSALKTVLAATTLCSLLISSQARACDHNDEDGLDVALVLSGGGALVTTQIGALAEIEALDIPIHCVIGSSMGSVVGGLYAAGFSAEELKATFRDDDWGRIFRGGTDRRDEAYLRKEEQDRYFSGYVAGFTEDGLTLPRGFGDMSGLQAHFRKLTSHISSQSSFDDLRVPYRAMAMNLSTGDAVAHSNGDLVEAMLASMAVPGVFPPRVIDGTTYVDGGMASQLPIKTAFAMGADIIIALDTTVQPPELGPRASITDVTQQLIRITVWRNWLAETALLRQGDVMIRPSLEKLTTSSFKKAQRGFDSGSTEAIKHRAALLAIKQRAAPHKQRTVDRKPIQPRTGQLIVENRSVIDDDVIEKRLGYHREDLNNPNQLDRRLRDLASYGAFGKVDLRVTEEAAHLEVEPLSLGRNLLQAGLRSSNNLEGDSTYALLAQLSRRPFGKRGGELRMAAEVGTNLAVTAEWYRPFGKEGRFFYTPGIEYRGEQILFDVGNFRIGEFLQQAGSARLRIGRELGQWGVIAWEGLATIGRISPEVSIDPENIRTTKYEQGGTGMLYALDTLDKSAWPTRGAQLKLNLQKLYDFSTGAETDKYSFSAMQAITSRNFGFVLRGKAEGVNNEDNEPVEILSLGGFRNLSAFSENSLPTNEYSMVSVEVFKRLTATDNVVNFPVYAGATFEYARINLDLFDEDEDASAFNSSVYLGAETVFGPLYIGIGAGDGQTSAFLHFGRGF